MDYTKQQSKKSSLWLLCAEVIVPCSTFSQWEHRFLMDLFIFPRCWSQREMGAAISTHDVGTQLTRPHVHKELCLLVVPWLKTMSSNKSFILILTSSYISIMGTLVFFKHGCGIAIQNAFFKEKKWNFNLFSCPVCHTHTVCCSNTNLVFNVNLFWLRRLMTYAIQEGDAHL